MLPALSTSFFCNNQHLRTKSAPLFSQKGSRLQSTLETVPGAPLVLDHGSAIFVWLGGAESGDRDGEGLAAAARGFVDSLAEGRLPLPEVRTIAQVTPCKKVERRAAWSVTSHLLV